MNRPYNRPWACARHRGVLLKEVRCRYFEIGMGRTATRSVYVAFKSFGLKAIHGSGGCTLCINDAIEKMEAGRIDLMLYETYEYCGHMPSFHWRQLAEERQDSKFILTLRPVDQWLKSAKGKIGTGGRADPRRGNMLHKRHYGSETPTKEQLREGFIRHSSEVQEYFAREPERLLVLDVFSMKDLVLWKLIADFVGGTPPEGKFPRRTTPIKVFNPENWDG